MREAKDAMNGPEKVDTQKVQSHDEPAQIPKTTLTVAPVGTIIHAKPLLSIVSVEGPDHQSPSSMKLSRKHEPPHLMQQQP